MGIFDQFYILFSSNSQDVIKGNKDAEKSSKDLERALSSSDKEAKELGKSFVKIVEGLTTAATAYISYGAIKSGIMNAESFGAALEKQSRFIGQTSTDMQELGYRAVQAGGDAASAMGGVKGMTETLADLGIQIKTLPDLLDFLHEKLKNLNTTDKLRIGHVLGANDDLIKLATDPNYEKNKADAKDLAKYSKEANVASLEFDRAWNNVSANWQKIWQGIDVTLLPVLTGMLKGLSKVLDEMGDNPLLSGVILTGLATAATAAVPAMVGFAGSLVGIETVAGGIAASLFKMTSGISAVLAVATYLPDLSVKAGQAIGNWYKGGHNSSGGSAKSPAATSAYAFWKSKGYTDAGAAAMAAQEQAESGGNPHPTTGDGVGAYQWHKDRAAAILKGKGIDVRTANIDDQREAAYWEANQRGDDKRVNAAGLSPFQAGGVGSRFFERPADANGEAYKRGIMAGQIAIANAGSSPFNSGANAGGGSSSRSLSVKIDNVNVHTQATDADGIAAGIKQSLVSQIGGANANWDDGVDY